MGFPKATLSPLQVDGQKHIDPRYFSSLSFVQWGNFWFYFLFKKGNGQISCLHFSPQVRVFLHTHTSLPSSWEDEWQPNCLAPFALCTSPCQVCAENRWLSHLAHICAGSVLAVKSNPFLWPRNFDGRGKGVLFEGVWHFFPQEHLSFLCWKRDQ